MKNKIFRIVCIMQLFIASGICIYYSSQENIVLPDIRDFDKLLHLGAYFIYGLSLQVALIAFFLNSKKTDRSIKLLVMLIGFLFALSDEIHQYFVPGRNADILDLLIDFIGVLLSLLLFNTVRRIIHFFVAKG